MLILIFANPKYDFYSWMVFAGMFVGIFGGATFFFLSQIFDATSYSFNKTENKFCVKGRRYLFKRLKIEDLTS